MVTDTPLRRVLYSSVNRRLKASPDSARDIAPRAALSFYLTSTSLIKGPPIRGVVRPRQDRSLKPPQGSVCRAPREEPPPEMGGALLRVKPRPSKGGQDMDKVNRVVGISLASYEAAPPNP